MQEKTLSTLKLGTEKTRRLLSFIRLMTNRREIRRVHDVVINIIIKLGDSFVVAAREKWKNRRVD